MFGRLQRFAVVLAALVGLASPAQPKELHAVTFDTDPPGVEIVNQYGDVVGYGGKVTYMDLSEMPTDFSLTFRLPGYKTQVLTVLPRDLRVVERWPSSPVRMVPTGATLAKRYVPLGGAVLLVLAGGAYSVLRSKRQLKLREELIPAGDSADSLVAMTLGKYRLISRLGQGGMATVYRGVPKDTLNPEEAVAVKVMRGGEGQPDMKARFLREIKLSSRLDHPHVVRLIDWGEEKGYIYLAMDLVDGGTLRQRMEAKPLEPKGAWDILDPLCTAVDYAHRAGIIHRDLKPENIMFTSKGTLKVMDFGLARSEVNTQRVTATGDTLGTPAYMSPEQIQSTPPAPSFDQYAIGVIAYELLTGRLPLDAGDAVQQIFQTLTEEPAPPSTHAPLSKRVDAVILRMLQKDPQARFPGVEAAAQALETALIG